MIYLLKKVNLGLDLQGGSYLLLEINSDSLVKEKFSQGYSLKKLLNENNISYSNFKIKDKSVSFKVSDIKNLIYFFILKRKSSKSLY